MLAHEPFSDHPASLCPVIAAFMRSYNDHVDDEHRRDLYAYAARAVGTNGGVAQERKRAQMCVEWVETSRSLAPLRVRILRRLLRCQGPDIDGVYAARAAAADPGSHHRALALLDRLIALGAPAGIGRMTRSRAAELVPSD